MIKQIIPLVLTLAVSANADVNYSKFGNAGSQDVDAIEDAPIKTPETSFDLVEHVKQYALYYGVPVATALAIALFNRGASRATGSLGQDDAFRLAMNFYGKTNYDKCGADMQGKIDDMTRQFVAKGLEFATEHMALSPVKKRY